MAQARVNSFIEGDHQDLTNMLRRFNYRVTEDLKTFFAVNYIKDAGNSYWGTPLVPVAFAGPYATNGVVSGTAFSHSFNNNFLGPVTIDSQYPRDQLQCARQLHRRHATLAAGRFGVDARSTA